MNFYRSEAEVGETSSTKGSINSDKENYSRFPRSEFLTRFEGSSTFDMSNPEYNNTYYRSTHDRVAANKKKQAVRNGRINKKTKNQTHLSGNFVMPSEQYEDMIQHPNSKGNGSRITKKTIINPR